MLGRILRIGLEEGRGKSQSRSYELARTRACGSGVVVGLEKGKKEENILVSPASPEKARMQWSLRARVLSSFAFRMEAPRMAALEAAMMVKSLPVIPRRTSLG